MEENKEFLKAKDYAYRLLSYRQRSTEEIKGRLERKGFTPKTIRDTIKYLSEIDYLNDENFARLWMRSKMQSSPLAFSLLRYQLRRKGIDSQIIENLVSDFAGQYNEYEVARELASSRRPRYKGLEPLKVKRRLYDYLRRRGFSHEVISQAINPRQTR